MVHNVVVNPQDTDASYFLESLQAQMEAHAGSNFAVQTGPHGSEVGVDGAMQAEGSHTGAQPLMNMPLLHQMLRVYLPIAMRQTPSLGVRSGPVTESRPATTPVDILNDSPFVASPSHFPDTPDFPKDSPISGPTACGLSPHELNIVRGLLSVGRVTPPSQDVPSASGTVVPPQANAVNEVHVQPSGINAVNALGVDLTRPPLPVSVGEQDGSPNHRRNFMRRQRKEYQRNQVNRGINGAKTVVPTDAEGNVIGLKSVLNRAIREIAGRVLDVSVKEFRHHPPMAFELIDHDIHSQFTFDPHSEVVISEPTYRTL